MAKIRREQVVDVALDLLDEVGLDGLSTRRLAQQLGVESATLYWHFRDKSVLLGEMASAVLARHHTLAVPVKAAQWPAWFADNMRSLRRALLAYRDGARLHAGTVPGPGDRAGIERKVAYLVGAGFTREQAGMALFAAGQYTLGCVLEEQARGAAMTGAGEGEAADAGAAAGAMDAETAFEFGLGVFVDGLRGRVGAAA
ncbi:Tetracycline repressor protein class B from transposon Tn10 [Achromobacter insuavis]|uniref:TetR/AcrR family transcriptional regulator C-terminal domain-containing protein n=1 Tax=Achromobacter insuavis TaxID=1287735 RepID=UPI0014682915|nr:TetR/AcrR family transcriptional regulator C-terminal domain-containing protein [Achromobacter insuavis]CAB3909506.1 Tetracycline repressor protein class B from transposon Tn10 [Achromobacter insuavis]